MTFASGYFLNVSLFLTSKFFQFHRYEREGHLMMSLRHPHIVQLLAASDGSDGNAPILVFEFMVSSVTRFSEISPLWQKN